MLLELKGVSKTFAAVEGENAEVTVLKDITLSLDRGESVAVVAPSGGGKSTLLSIAGLLLQPTEGSVAIDGRDVTALPDDERSALRARNIGFLFQHTQLIGSLRALENVLLPADFADAKAVRTAGQTQAESFDAIQQRAVEMMCDFGLEERMLHFPFQLSVGQKRRIATARALVLEPALIIADEPTNDLDGENARRVVDALFRRVEAGDAGLLLATHDPALAQRADRIFEIG